jgi:hypothetical protein
MSDRDKNFKKTNNSPSSPFGKDNEESIEVAKTAAIEPFRKGKGRNFQDISRVLPRVLRQLGIDNRLKEHTFLHLWPHIIGEPFASRTRPLFIDHERNVVIAVKDAATGQEISFSKADLIKKLRQAARGVGIEINGMRFDMKRFFEKADSDLFAYPFQEPLPEPSDADLQSIELSDEESAQIAQVATNFESGAEFTRLALRMRSLYEKELRLKKWRLAHGYPHCSQCGDVTSRLHGANLICPLCFSTSMVEMPRGGYT